MLSYHSGAQNRLHAADLYTIFRCSDAATPEQQWHQHTEARPQNAALSTLVHQNGQLTLVVASEDQGLCSGPLEKPLHTTAS